MIDELSKCYEVLGVQPGISPEQLKTAHRDLAKVWHPDRFGHDPRLQSKAQEKLKEINEAYDQISSGKFKRRAAQRDQNSAGQTRNRNYAQQYDQADDAQNRKPSSAPAKASMRWQFVVGTLLVFGVAFLFTTRSLLSSGQSNSPRVVELSQESASAENASDDRIRAEAVDKRAPNTKANDEVAKNEEADPGEPPIQPRAVTTETVLVDTTTGLLARPQCPLKSRMTFVSGNQPTQYCGAAHSPPTPKDSKIKAVTRRVASPGEWFGGKKSEAPDKKSQ